MRLTRENRGTAGKEQYQASEYNKEWESYIQDLLCYRDYMEDVYGLSFLFNQINVDFNAIRAIDGQKADNDLFGSVFLAKNLTYLKFYDEQGQILEGKPVPDIVKKVVITYNNQFDVEYRPGNQADNRQDSFVIQNLTRDYMAPTEVAAGQAILEQAKAAIILVMTAKEAGWTHVNFAETKDPLQRYLLKQTCEMFGLDCSGEDADPNLIPHNPVYNANPAKKKNHQTMQEIADKTMKSIREDIFREPADRNAAAEPEHKETISDIPPSNNDNDMSQDIVAYEARRKTAPIFK